MPDQGDLTINGQTVNAGKTIQINASIAKLPTRTPIDIPIIVSRAKADGPTLLLMAGMHGDEVNGVEIVRRILHNKYNTPIKGTVICIPLVNVLGFITMSRVVSGGKDINRSFPGSKTGSLASQVAYFLRKEILPHIDYGIDFHTGGARINNVPQLRFDTANPISLDLAEAFSPRFILNSDLREKSLRKEAGKRNIPFLVFEGGESLRLVKSIIDVGVSGALRVMKYLQMTEVDAPDVTNEPILLEKSYWVRAKSAGIFHSLARAGSIVSKNEIVGKITSPYADFEYMIKVPKAGHIIAINNNPIIHRGDALLHIGIE